MHLWRVFAVGDVMWFFIVALLLLNAALVVWVALRRGDGGASAAQAHAELLQVLQANADRIDRLERELRREMSEAARDGRQESAQNLATFQQTLTQQSAEATRTQNTQIDAFGLQLAGLQKSLSDTLSTQLTGLSESNARRIAELSETSARTLAEVRKTLDAQLAQLQTTNAAKLDEMRATVDEKLQTTLQARLGAGFKQVADQLEQVHKGLGEMQTLAQGVGDLKHLLSNVKTRGIFGEAQLASLLEQVFVGDQYAAQVATRPGSKNVVDFAIKLPGKSEDGAPLWLPIDAKFPNEDYERLLDAQGRAHAADAAEAG
ncbi:MAG: DNA recombination protein RmuC, partial [Rhodoferax sp.]